MPYSLSRRSLLIAALATVSVGSAHAGNPAIYGSSGVAASGYDVVAYFTEGRPVDGSDAYTAAHDGATWRFASAANRDLFVANPTNYAPQYGGYCAYAAAQGSKAPTVPEAWKIVDNKLYLNYSKGVQRRWESNEASYIADADRNWPSIAN